MRQDLSGWELFAACPLPCVAAVGRECNTPRMPTLRGKMAAAKKEPLLLRIENFSDQTPTHFGAEGSPTRVTRVFAPERAKAGEWLQGTEQEILAQATARIRAQIKSGGNVHDGDFGR